MMQRKSQRGFTTIELVLILVVIGILLALVISTRSGVQQNERNNQRQSDIKELRDGLEGYFAANNHYPTLQELNDANFRKANFKSVDPEVFRDPSSKDSKFADKPGANVYTYQVTSAGGTACGTAEAPCTQYTLTATLEGGGTYTKNNLN